MNHPETLLATGAAPTPKTLPTGYYYLKVQSRIQGPFHYSRILKFFRDGRLHEKVLFSSDQSHWVSVNYFPHFESEEETTAVEVQELPLSTLNLNALETCYLRHEGNIQGPYDFERVLRYVKEKRLPIDVDFSQDQKQWERLLLFFKRENYYLSTRDKVAQGPYHFSRILRYKQEGRFAEESYFSQNKQFWFPIKTFPYLSSTFLKETRKIAPSASSSKESGWNWINQIKSQQSSDAPELTFMGEREAFE